MAPALSSILVWGVGGGFDESTARRSSAMRSMSATEIVIWPPMTAPLSNSLSTKLTSEIVVDNDDGDVLLFEPNKDGIVRSNSSGFKPNCLEISETFCLSCIKAKPSLSTSCVDNVRDKTLFCACL